MRMRAAQIAIRNNIHHRHRTTPTTKHLPHREKLAKRDLNFTASIYTEKATKYSNFDDPRNTDDRKEVASTPPQCHIYMTTSRLHNTDNWVFTTNITEKSNTIAHDQNLG